MSHPISNVNNMKFFVEFMLKNFVKVVGVKKNKISISTQFNFLLFSEEQKAIKKEEDAVLKSSIMKKNTLKDTKMNSPSLLTNKLGFGMNTGGVGDDDLKSKFSRMKTIASDYNEVPIKETEIKKVWMLFGKKYHWKLINIQENLFRLIFELVLTESKPGNSVSGNSSGNFSLDLMFSPIQLKKYFFFYTTEDHSKLSSKL